MEGKGGVRSNTKGVRSKIVSLPRLLYAGLYSIYSRLYSKESETDKIRIIAGHRAVKFEEKALKGDNRRLLIECIKAREREKGSKEWMEEREVFYRQNGFSTEGIKDLRKRGGYKGHN